jgi:hypothetical protein
MNLEAAAVLVLLLPVPRNCHTWSEWRSQLSDHRPTGSIWFELRLGEFAEVGGWRKKTSTEALGVDITCELGLREGSWRLEPRERERADEGEKRGKKLAIVSTTPPDGDGYPAITVVWSTHS